jgi:hypothetical protein
MKLLLAVAALLFCAQAAAQPLHKCRDAGGKVTYASQECEVLGLKPAGEIQDRSSVAPAYKAPPPAPAAARPTPAPAAKVADGAAAPAEPPKEERRCFTVRTAKGMATRCNDTPDKD